jgi:hypothetical protein
MPRITSGPVRTSVGIRRRVWGRAAGIRRPRRRCDLNGTGFGPSRPIPEILALRPHAPNHAPTPVSVAPTGKGSRRGWWATRHPLADNRQVPAGASEVRPEK